MWKVSKELSKDRNARKSFIKTRLNHRYVENINSNMMLRDLVPFVQFKTREKHQWRRVIFSKVEDFKS